MSGVTWCCPLNFGNILCILALFYKLAHWLQLLCYLLSLTITYGWWSSWSSVNWTYPTKSACSSLGLRKPCDFVAFPNAPSEGWFFFFVSMYRCIYCTQKSNPNDLWEPLTFSFVPPAGQFFHLSIKLEHLQDELGHFVQTFVVLRGFTQVTDEPMIFQCHHDVHVCSFNS